MGNISSMWSNEERRDEVEVSNREREKSVLIRLNCADFGTFNGRADQWISFKDNILSKAGVGGYSQYLQENFKVSDRNEEGNQRIFYLLQSATNGGGGAAHVVQKFTKSANGHAAWQALLAWYEGPVMSGEIARGLRNKLWALRLRPREEANRYINDFILYSDRLKELDRETREETLIDLFLDSITDDKYAGPIANRRLNERITLEECYEAIRKYDNVITRENIKEDNIARFNQLRRVEQGSEGTYSTDTSYKPYKEWMNLTSEQRKEIHKARNEAQAKGMGTWKKTDEHGKNTERTYKINSRKCHCRVTFKDDGPKGKEEEQSQGEAE
jgi:hypothetical protein